MRIKGIIYKLLGGNYYVDASGQHYICKARGVFRHGNIKPLVGDYVEITPDEFEGDKGVIVDVLPRKNALVRPPVANIDQSIIVIAVKKPKPNVFLLDKMILMSEIAGVKPVIVFNKIDLIKEDEMAALRRIYAATGYTIIETSAEDDETLTPLFDVLKDKVSAFSGPSGVGKSTLLNTVVPNANLVTGDISKKIKRGKHTTRHSELISLAQGGFVLDTPGFTSLDISGVAPEDLDAYFHDIFVHVDECKYDDCTHINEPNCGVKHALEQGLIDDSRYTSYVTIYRALTDNRRY